MRLRHSNPLSLTGFLCAGPLFKPQGQSVSHGTGAWANYLRSQVLCTWNSGATPKNISFWARRVTKSWLVISMNCEPQRNGVFGQYVASLVYQRVCFGTEPDSPWQHRGIDCFREVAQLTADVRVNLKDPQPHPSATLGVGTDQIANAFSNASRASR